jgi:hypothetical protein
MEWTKQNVSEIALRQNYFTDDRIMQKKPLGQWNWKRERKQNFPLAHDEDDNTILQFDESFL